MKDFARLRSAVLLCTSCCLYAGCDRGQAQLAPPQQAPEVKVSLPVTREVTDYEDFPGRTESVKAVEVRPGDVHQAGAIWLV